MKSWYNSNVRRRLEQSVMQRVGVAEKHEDDDFEMAVRQFRATAADVARLHDVLAKHLESTRKYLRESATVAAEMNRFLKLTDLSRPAQGFEDAQNRMDQQSGDALERVYAESVLRPLEAVMEGVPDLEGLIKKHKALSLDFAYNTRKHEKAVADNEKKKAKGKDVDAAGMAERSTKLFEAEKSLKSETAWLIEKFQEIDDKRASGELARDSLTALVTTQLHLAGRLCELVGEPVAPLLLLGYNDVHQQSD